MERIGAGFGDHVDHRAGVAADIGTVHVGLDLELADRFHRRTEHNGEREPLIVVDSVEEEVVRSLAIAIGEDLRSRTAVVWARAAHDRARGGEAGSVDAGAECRELMKLRPFSGS